MKKRIFWALVAIALLSGLLYTLLISSAIPDYTRRRTLLRMQQELSQLRARAGQEGGISPDYLGRVVTLGRLSLIGADGSVLFDSDAAAAQMENHLQRPEVSMALQQGSGSHARLSQTTGEEMLYYAQRLPQHQVLRLGQPLKLIQVSPSEILPWLVAGLILSLVASLALSGALTRQFTRAIDRIDLDRPEEALAYEELSPMLSRLNQQNLEVQHQMRALSQKQLEMDALLNGMSEGFLALDGRRRIISINQSAASLLHTQAEDALGKTLAELSRQPEMMHLVDELYEQGSAQVSLPWDKRSYALSANLVADSGKAVILLRDVTQAMEGEAMRKRFTANVSHELRTPLTSICGYAEMLQAGMVKQEDQQQVLGRIASESRRMLALVEDILRLSRLDEGYPGGQFTRVDLQALARGVMDSLSPLAAQRGVSLKLKGDTCSVMGDPTLLGELLSNLVDNAIKYNREGGQVTVSLSQEDGQRLLQVADTGLGIEPSQQDKIFERFYRTDSSRSKHTGGTGLGLSIVKHSAEYHHAKLSLESQPGQGTTITVSFPAAIDM